MVTPAQAIGRALAAVVLAIAPLRAAPAPFASSGASAIEPRELRGVWISAQHSDVFASRASIADAIEFLAHHHVNVVFPEVWYRGVTLHPSRVLESAFGVPQDPRYAGRDPLDELIVEAHVRGLEVVPWFSQGMTASSTAYPTTLLEKKPDWAARDRDGRLVEKDGFSWMNSFDPAVQEFVSGLMLEVARGYDVDGVQCDHRMPALPAVGGYDKGTVERWRQEKRYAPPPAADSRWTAWRAGLLTDYFARLAKELRGVGPGIVLSSSPTPYRWGLDEYLQDSKGWLDRGLVDLFHPQCYRRDLASYEALVDSQRELMPRNSRTVFAPAIQIQSGDWRIESAELVRMVEHNRDRGYGGEVLFHYAGLRADDGALARALLAGPYEEAARVPYRSARWRPKAREVAGRPATAPESFSREKGVLRAAAPGAAEVVYALSGATSGTFRIVLEVPDVEGSARVARCTLTGTDVAPRRIELRPGLVDVATVRLADESRQGGAAGRVELRIATDADEAGRLTVGRVLLSIDRKRSPDAVWRDG